MPTKNTSALELPTRSFATSRAFADWLAKNHATVPDDLAAALAGNARASALFDGLHSRNRYAILHRVQTAKKPETRARRIAEFVTMMARREKLYP